MKHLSWVALAGTLAVLLALLSNGCAPMAQTTEAQPTAAVVTLSTHFESRRT
jgi:hypothetical protein